LFLQLLGQYQVYVANHLAEDVGAVCSVDDYAACSPNASHDSVSRNRPDAALWLSADSQPQIPDSIAAKHAGSEPGAVAGILSCRKFAAAVSAWDEEKN